MRFSAFLLSFLAIYAAMHVTVFLGVRPLLAGRGKIGLLVGAWMLLMAVAPIGVRLLSRAGLEGAARPFAFLAYTWMGFLLLAFSGFLLVHAWNLLLPLIGGHPLASTLQAGPRVAGAVLALAAMASLYGLWEAAHLRVETVRIETRKLPPGMERLRVAQVSDLHLGLMRRGAALRQTLERLEALRPDLLVATGDLVDAQINHLDGLAEAWDRFRPPLGKYAVVGNHEVHAGLSQSTDFLRRSGFVLLRNEAVPAGEGLTLAGVDDPATGRAADEAALLPAAGGERFTILLKHRPEVASAGRFDLQLSGHTHRGQIFPFNLLTGLFYPKQDGLYLLEGGSRLYTSRGTGTWGPPMRVLAPPEITLFELVRPTAGTATRE